MLSLALMIAQLSGARPLPLDTAGRTLKDIWQENRDRVRTLLHECLALEEVRNTMSNESYTAIEHCLRCFGDPRFRFTETEMVESMLREVVRPLLEEKIYSI